MSRTARTLFIASLLLLSIGAFGQQASFSYDPPRDFFSRTSMDDCVQRFYSVPEEFHSQYESDSGSRVYREFQHMVIIGRIEPNGTFIYFCGASLITHAFVLTTAYCVDEEFTGVPNTVKIGDTDLAREEDNEHAQHVGIGRIIVHPRFRRYKFYFDIALIQLAEPIRYSAAVCPACLWREPSLPPEPMDAIRLKRKGFEETLTLMRVRLGKIEQSSCNEQIKRSFVLTNGLRDDQFCMNPNYLFDASEGDVAAPIDVKRPTVGGFVVPLVVGTVSFTVHDRPAEPIEVYTKISSYIDWIEREVNQTLTGEECSKNLSCFEPQNSTITIADFPRHKSLQRFGLIWNDTAPSLYECGATLIDYEYLLTSASCVTTNRDGPSYVSYDGKERIAVEEVYVSPSYIRGRPENDVALMKIAKFTNPMVHRPSCLWNRRTDGEWSTHPVVSAYGPSEPLLPSDSSQRVNRTISIRPKHTKDCKADGLRGSDLIRCLNRVQKVPPLCSMDYGAPVTNDRGKPEDPNYIYGVVSSLNEGCESKLIITDVTPHIVWIEDTIINGRYIFSDTRHRSLVPHNRTV